jgi:hypothetical protein
MIPLRHLFTNNAPLTDEDKRAIREHPSVGADMLPAEFSPVARAVVRTHHENFDGSGYPDGMEGESIHVFSRIVRIADAFDAATASYVYKQAKSPARSIWEMSAGPYSRFYDPVLMKVIAGLIQPFPVGARLELSDGRSAVVVQYNRKQPFKPTVVIATDAKGGRLSKAELEEPFCLAERDDLQIGSFEGEDLSYLYDSAFMAEISSFSNDFSTIFEAVFP